MRNNVYFATANEKPFDGDTVFEGVTVTDKEASDFSDFNTSDV